MIIIDDTYGYDNNSRIYHNYCPTLRSERSGIKIMTDVDVIESNSDKEIDNSDNPYRIRKLTPKECWRLMGFSDENFDKARQAINDKFHKGKDKANSQLYKQAGNSIVTNVLYYIFKELYSAMPYLFEDLKVSSYFSSIGAFEIALDRLFNDDVGNKELTGSSGGREIIIYDDYNSNIRADQNTIGTITTNIGSYTLRNAYKLIES